MSATVDGQAEEEMLGSDLSVSDLEWNDGGLLVRTSKDETGGKGYVCDAEVFWWSLRPEEVPAAESKAVESTAMETET
jgi:hypothetical protein